MRQIKTSTILIALVLLGLVAFVGAKQSAKRSANFETKCAEMGGRVEGALCLAPNGDVMIRNS